MTKIKDIPVHPMDQFFNFTIEYRVKLRHFVESRDTIDSALDAMRCDGEAEITNVTITDK